ncbi:MAG: DedA family protein [Nitrospirae bacterium CG_4_9_14_3_um_filter_41_27]|nr:DedA family protein [Nitrospirota bacterium]PIW86785.1 MAG: DedA family protein [Nitrospirae bacterium CG_4_8_14_3_um_filter_41_47]PJA81099.1 MAG: DedA family protein [Nitrospirae bacterium CG_4_9_14_3_um_filter_41_27]
MHAFLNWLVDTIGSMGYPGIMALMFVESTFIPLPSELVIPPAGYLISQDQMSWAGVIVSGTVGSLLGALFNYAIAVYLGRPFILKYGKYFGITQKHLLKGENFFLRHGNISIFIGRLILGVRHYISFPAGLCRMNLGKFCLYTTFGAGLWVGVLAYIGYFVGNNKERIMEVSRQWSLYVIIGCALLIAIYIFRHKRKQKNLV